MKEEINNLNSGELIIVIYKEIVQIKEKLREIDLKMNSKFFSLENKIDNEIKERKEEIARIDGRNDLDRIVLSDFR